MKVPKEIASKAERYEELKKEIDTLYEELEEFANENGFEDFWINGFGVSQEPNGEEQTEKNKQMENIATNGCAGKIQEMEYITIQLKEVRNIFG